MPDCVSKPDPVEIAERLRKIGENLQCKKDSDIFLAADEIEKYENKLRIALQSESQMSTERDAAIADIYAMHNKYLANGKGKCFACKNDVFDCDKSTCAGCDYTDNYEWRGTQEESLTVKRLSAQNAKLRLQLESAREAINGFVKTAKNGKVSNPCFYCRHQFADCPCTKEDKSACHFDLDIAWGGDAP